MTNFHIKLSFRSLFKQIHSEVVTCADRGKKVPKTKRFRQKPRRKKLDLSSESELWRGYAFKSPSIGIEFAQNKLRFFFFFFTLTITAKS